MELNQYIEHTNLAQSATEDDIKKLVSDAINNSFFGVCVNPIYVKLAKELIGSSNLKLVCVVNFPLGANLIETTLSQVKSALGDGADEIDTVICVSDIKNNNWTKIQDEIKQIKNVCNDHNLKVILETDLLNCDEIRQASLICAKAGANFVKTSTGFVKNGVGAKASDVKLMFDTVKDFGVGVKASGGIKTREQAIELINNGATRLGTSSGVEIIKG